MLGMQPLGRFGIMESKDGPGAFVAILIAALVGLIIWIAIFAAIGWIF